VAVLALLALAGCETTYLPVSDPGLDYFPLEAGTYRIYNVTDSMYNRSILQPVMRYQIRESIASTDGFTDAAGNRSYRVVRSKRVPAVSMTWQPDSVYVLSGNAQTVTLVKDNRRTVELVFPVLEGNTWNMHAYNNNGGDTISSVNRRSQALGQPFSTTTTTVGTSTPITMSYPQTVTVDDTGDEYTANNECELRSYRQVFAKGVGPVLRYRRSFSFADPSMGICNRSAGRTYFGNSRTEVLVEYGR